MVPGGALRAKASSMTGLSNVLGAMVDRSVVDQTGLTGTYVSRWRSPL